MSEATFVLCVEQTGIREQALLLCESIRAFGGSQAAAPIVAVAPRAGLGVDRRTRQALARLDVEYAEVALNDVCPEYGSANRVFAAAWAEPRAATEWIVVLDSDTVLLDPLPLPADADVALRPVDSKGSASAGAEDAFEPYWQALAALQGIGVDGLPFVATTDGLHRVRASYNGGLVAARRSAGLLVRWADLFARSVAAGLRPWRGRGENVHASTGYVGLAASEYWGSNQAALAVAAWSAGLRVHEIPRHLQRAAAPAGAAAGPGRGPGRTCVADGTDSRPLPLDVHRAVLSGGVRHAARARRAGRSARLARRAAANRVSAMADADLSIVVPTRDTAALTLACLASIARAGRARGLEVIVVDDASRDDTVARVQDAHPGARILRHDAPRGFTVSANDGLAAAGGRLLLLLNSDTEIEPGGLDALVDAFAQDPGLGIAGAQLRDPDGAAQWSGGRLPDCLWLFAEASGAGGCWRACPSIAAPGRSTAAPTATSSGSAGRRSPSAARCGRPWARSTRRSRSTARIWICAAAPVRPAAGSACFTASPSAITTAPRWPRSNRAPDGSTRRSCGPICAAGPARPTVPAMRGGRPGR